MNRICIDTFIDAEDSVVTAGGKRYYFEFHEMFGPTLTDKKGNVLKRQPMNANHPFWKPFEAWNQQRSKLRYTKAKGQA
jgi:hypothetical protein